MRIGIVGANSDVGMELSLLLRAKGIDVVPLVRDKLATAFFKYHGFDSKVFDSSSKKARNTVIESLDAVVIAARSSGSNIQKRQDQNNLIIKNTVKNCGKNTSVIYLSSLAALGKQFYGDTMSELTVRNYIEEKRRGERVLREAAKDADLSAYALRLGIVAGPTQEITTRIATCGNTINELHLKLDPTKLSNVVHTVTIQEAVERCAHRDVASGIYPIVNVPQWTWEEVIEHSIPTETTVWYHPIKKGVSGTSLPTQILEHGWRFVRWIGQDMIYPVRIRVPSVIEKFAVAKGKRESAKHEIEDISKRKQSVLRIPEGRYRSIGETNALGLSETKHIIEQETVISDVFDSIH